MNAFWLYPAIDLRRGRVVRLHQGRDDELTDYGGDPVGVAEAFEAQGAQALHVVDLDGAFGDGRQHDVIASIVARVSMRVQVGGGLRDDASVAAMIDAGAARVIIGSAAVERPDWVGELVSRYGAKVVAGLDARDGEVRLRGWVDGSGQELGVVAHRMAELGVREIIYTDIGRDGALRGPDIDGARALATSSGVKVIVSGGVSGADDIRRASTYAEEGLSGIIVGKALYEGRVTLAEALEATHA